MSGMTGRVVVAREQLARIVAENQQLRRELRGLYARLQTQRCPWCGCPLTGPCLYGMEHGTPRPPLSGDAESAAASEQGGV